MALAPNDFNVVVAATKQRARSLRALIALLESNAVSDADYALIRRAGENTDTAISFLGGIGDDVQAQTLLF